MIQPFKVEFRQRVKAVFYAALYFAAKVGRCNLSTLVFLLGKLPVAFG